MKLRYFLRGLGAGILFTAIVMGISGKAKEQVTITDNEIIARARALGMVTKEEKIEEELNGLLESVGKKEDTEKAEKKANKEKQEKEQENLEKEQKTEEEKTEGVETSESKETPSASNAEKKEAEEGDKGPKY